MKIGYIKKYDLSQNPQLTEKFRFIESNCTRRISNNSDRVYSKSFYPIDYDEIAFNAKIMKDNGTIILVGEPFLLDDELKEKATKWVEWANRADPIEYDPFARS